MKWYQDNNYFGYTREYLDSVECYLTYKGACKTEACARALRKWRKLNKKTLTAAEVVENFQDYCIACWISNVRSVLCSSQYFGSWWASGAHNSFCACLHPILSGEQLKELTRWVKALIILISTISKD